MPKSATKKTPKKRPQRIKRNKDGEGDRRQDRADDRLVMRTFPDIPVLNKLPEKHALFVLEFVQDLNATKACIRAGYEPDHAHTMGWYLRSLPEVQEAIQEIQNDRARRLQWGGDRVVLELVDTYTRATESSDYSTAVSALDKLGKVFGIYEQHNKQKRDASLTELELVMARLAEYGINAQELRERKVPRLVEAEPAQTEDKT